MKSKWTFNVWDNLAIGNLAWSFSWFRYRLKPIQFLSEVHLHSVAVLNNWNVVDFCNSNETLIKLFHPKFNRSGIHTVIGLKLFPTFEKHETIVNGDLFREYRRFNHLCSSPSKCMGKLTFISKNSFSMRSVCILVENLRIMFIWLIQVFLINIHMIHFFFNQNLSKIICHLKKYLALFNPKIICSCQSQVTIIEKYIKLSNWL